jgi:hypothetical protein
MPRIPYERIAPEANKMFDRMTTASDIKTLRFWYNAYVSLLAAAGWDPVSFDKETLKRVDEGWDDTKPIVWN